MCGIAGIFALADQPVSEAALPHMNAAMLHRGPDEAGLFCDGRAGLAMRRLSIIGLSNGHQPIFNEDASLALIMNGEIYNHRPVRRLLEAQGHRFRTESDTEVAVHLYEEHGLRGVDALRGMFAFALYDQRRGRLILGRDRCGKKPLYYAVHGGYLVFASEIKALHAAGLVPKELNAHALDSYLTQGYVVGEETLFAHVHKLPAGSLLVASGAGIEVQAYWDLPLTSAPAPRMEDAGVQVRERLEAAVSARMMSEVPIGAFLSGGIDSSAVVALMAGQLRVPVRTFAVGFDGQLDELAYARAAATALGTQHHELIVRDCSPYLLWQINWHNDEPAGDPAAVPTFELARFARQHVTVVLTGEGGDELFAGYHHYRADRRLLQLEDRLPGLSAAARAAAPLASPLPSAGAHRLRKAIWIAGLPRAERARAWLSAFTDAEVERLYNPDFWHAHHNGHQAGTFRRCAERAAGLDSTGRSLYVDAKFHLADQLLMKVDKMTMAASLEARCPFLDQDLLEYVGALPSDLKLSAAGSKLVLREAVRGLIPEEILVRPKQGFDPPIRRWMLGGLTGLADELLLQPDAAVRTYLDIDAVRAVWATMRMHDNDRIARQCWIMLNFAVWHAQHWPDHGREIPATRNQ